MAIAAIFTGLLYACKSNSNQTTTSEPTQQVSVLSPSPVFNADSAYAFVQKQVDFGPRVPNTAAHQKCGAYLVHTLKQYGLTVTEQNFVATTHDGKKLNSKNIIGAYNPQAKKRILLAAHWDSRPFATEDAVDKTKPVMGANDGASGVGVLLELARTLSIQEKKMDLGVDIIFFDAEDWGNSEEATDAYGGFCLGSQYWAAKKHIENYTAHYGILLDMVGAKNATFQKEGYSVQFADDIVKKVWNTATQLGFSNYFINQNGPAITDDHVPVNQIAKIPMIDIIHTRMNNPSHTFFDAWHTAQDDMSVIDTTTLKAVGQTLIQVLYQEDGGKAL